MADEILYSSIGDLTLAEQLPGLVVQLLADRPALDQAHVGGDDVFAYLIARKAATDADVLMGGEERVRALPVS